MRRASLASSGHLLRGGRKSTLLSATTFSSHLHDFDRDVVTVGATSLLRAYSSRRNTVVNFVPQQEAWVVQRFGKFLRVLEPGLRVLMPFIDSIAYVQSLKVVTLEVPNQVGITKDNVSIEIDGVLYYQVVDPYKASYNIADAEFAITQLAMSTMRVEVGKLTLDKTFEEREQMNANIVSAINQTVSNWGLNCLRYEIRDITPPARAMEAMELQMVAERRRRQKVIRSEAVRTAAVNEAEGKKQALILKAEGLRLHRELVARGEAEAIKVKASATAEAIAKVAAAIGKNKGSDAVAMSVAEKYVDAFSKLAKQSNTILLPANTGDVGSMVAQALTIFESISQKRNGNAGSVSDDVEEERQQPLEQVVEEEEGQENGGGEEQGVVGDMVNQGEDQEEEPREETPLYRK